MPPTKKIDIVLDGTQAFTDEVLRFPGAGAVTLQHDYFEDQGFAVRTAAGGGGTLLVRDTHYTLGNEHISLGSRCSAAQSPTVVAVFNTLTITSASYQNVDLYVSGNYVADSIEGEDVVDPAKREQLEGLLANDLDEGTIFIPTPKASYSSSPPPTASAHWAGARRMIRSSTSSRAWSPRTAGRATPTPSCDGLRKR